MTASFAQLALFGSLLGFGLLTLLLPMIRHRLSHGQGTGLMLAHLDDPVSKVVGVGMSCQNAAVAAYAVCHLLLDPARLSVWAVPHAVHVLGAGVIGVATIVTVAGQTQMGRSWRMCVDEKRTELVTRGLFSFIRNPIYLGSTLVLYGMVMLAPSPWTVCLLMSGQLLVALQVRLEEAHLIKLHGESYRRYAARVGRFVPGVGLFRAPEAG